MKISMFLVIIIIIFTSYGCTSMRQTGFDAFTHPDNLQAVSIYSKPNKLYTSLQPDVEAGWIVRVKKKHMDFFKIELPASSKPFKKNVWIKAGDIGVIIQNHDSIKIPAYLSSNNLSTPYTYILNSMIGKIYDVKDNVVLLSIKLYSGEIIECWVEKKYLCGNPYTTCN